MQIVDMNKTKLASCLSLILGTATFIPITTQAQENSEDDVEVIEIRGIRSSLIKSMDVKRGSNGVVDAITAEDIGKMPDANLAESLQRITGVSIDRSGGEGSKITVRGFGPEFNLVTLNGRQMPTTGGRSFDFADLATESVSGVEVYKTADASKPSGGIGATVNITTNKPLSSPGFKASVGAKAVHSVEVEEGDSVTPEFSALISNTFADNTIGVLISGSYQEYHSRSEGATVDKWFPSDFDRDSAFFTPNDFENADIVDNNTRDIYWYPQNAGYNFSDFERERTNAQAVVQWAPTTELTATVDYTYSKVDRISEGAGFGVWFFERPLVRAEINERGTYTHLTERGGDYATNLNRSESRKENKSLGINIDWDVSDTFNVEIDFHTSEATDEGQGLGQNAFLIIGNTSCDPTDWYAAECDQYTADINEKYANYGNGGVPIWGFDLVDGLGNPQDELTGNDLGSLFGAAILTGEENEMDQLRFKGTWINESDSALTEIEFGASYTEMDFRSINRNSEQLAAGFWQWSANFYSPADFERVSTDGLLDHFGNGGSFPVGYFYSADFDVIRERFENIESDDPYGAQFWAFSGAWPAELGGQFQPGPIDDDHRVNEETMAFYVQFNFETEFNDFPISMVVGLRYEDTDVTSNSLERPATNLVWLSGSEWSYIFADSESFSDGTGNTSEFLPNFDLAIDITDDIIGRFSYSRSMTRPNISALRSATSFGASPKVGQRRVSVGNPELQPFLADNIDLSLEYYYEDGSYASLGYYRKDVENFIINRTTKEDINGIVDPYIGDCAAQARANLEANGEATGDAAVHAEMNNLGCNRDGAVEIVGGVTTDPNNQGWVDPLAIYDVSRDYNDEDGTLWGWEVAWQHMHDSGFGFSANATFVYGDIEADREAFGFQFALPGLSDSANLSLIYDDTEAFSARISMNWRDEFLTGFDGDSSPVYTEAYTQWDFNVNYAVTEKFTVFVEGLNVLEETLRTYTRYEEQFLSGVQYGARYNFGVRYTF